MEVDQKSFLQLSVEAHTQFQGIRWDNWNISLQERADP